MKAMNLLAVLLVALSLPAIAQKKPATGKQYGSCHTKTPEMSFSFDSTKLKGRGLADNYYLWDNGKVLNVKFLSGSKRYQDIVKAAAREWEKYANVKFNFVEDGPAQIRVLLNDEDGYWSMLGTQATMIDENEHTMNLDTTGGNFRYEVSMKGTIMHEFGHAIGLLHEHFSPVSGIDWNKEAVYKDHEGIWDQQTVDYQIFRTYKMSYTNGTKYDNKSIMHYPIDPRHTKNGYKVDWNFQISEGDKQLVGILYPKSGERTKEVPRFTVTDVSKVEVVNGNGKLSVFPSFYLNTAGKSGTVYFMVMLYDQQGNPILDNDDKYNVFGVVGAYDGGVYKPGFKLAANKTAKDFELAIPHDQIPLSSGAKAMVVFKAYLFNEEEELKLLYSSNPTTFSFKKSN